MRGGGRMVAVALGLAVLAGCARGDTPDAGSAELAALQRDERCGEMVSAEVRSEFLAGWVERAPPQLGSHWTGDPLVCTFAHPASRARVTLTSDCRARARPREIAAVREDVLEREGTEITGLGRAAVRAKPQREVEQITAWDDDSPCTWTITWYGEGREQAVELLRGLIAPAAAIDVGAPETDTDAGVTAPLAPVVPNLLEP